MGIKLHGGSMSTCTQRVTVVLKEKGVEFELVPVDFSLIKSPEYKEKMQPFGQIPVLEDDGFFIYESRAMARYIALKYAKQGTPNLIPSGADLQEVARFERAMSFEVTQFASAEQIVEEAMFKPYKGGTTDPEAVARYTEQLQSKMDAYDRILAKSKYLAGDHITLADLFHLPYADMVTNALKIDALTSPSRPNVARWWKDISSRDSWKAVKASISA